MRGLKHIDKKYSNFSGGGRQSKISEPQPPKEESLIVFTDGACTKNGTSKARASIPHSKILKFL